MGSRLLLLKVRLFAPFRPKLTEGQDRRPGGALSSWTNSLACARPQTCHEVFAIGQGELPAPRPLAMLEDRDRRGAKPPPT